MHTQALNQYAATITDPQELIGMMVVVTEKNFKGEIVEITGSVAEKRNGFSVYQLMR